MNHEAPDGSWTNATIEQLLDRRHSCRAFTDQVPARDMMEEVLALAQRTASWCNAQPWHAHIVFGERLEALRQAMLIRATQGALAQPDLEWPREYVGVYQQRRRDCGWALYDAVGVAKGDRTASARLTNENFRFFGAPCLVVLSTPRSLGVFGAIDCGGWLANFMMAATSRGIATVAQAAAGSWPDLLRKHLYIGHDRQIICGVSCGYENTAHPANVFRTARERVDKSVTWIE